MQQPRETAEVIQQFNQAFVHHDATLLLDLIGDDCVMESIEPAPDGTRFEGRDVCLGFWQALATDSSSSFTPEDVVISGDRATIRWRYRFGEGDVESVRGVNLMRVHDGKIVEALGYAKSGQDAIVEALGEAMSR